MTKDWKVFRDVVYFRDFDDAARVVLALGFQSRAVYYTRGWAVQFRPSGHYVAPDHLPWLAP